MEPGNGRSAGIGRGEGEAALGALPVAVDAMGGDHAPGEILAGARLAREELGIPIVLVGPPDQLGDTGGIPVIPASEVIGMDDDPGNGVRTKKDSSMVRAAEAVRDGRALAMVSAGNTGAAMAAALLRMGRLSGVIRPGMAVPVPNPGTGRPPTILLDAGANAECTPAMLVQFAQLGAAFAAQRYEIEMPRVALLSIGEEKSKGTPMVKETHELLASGAGGKGLDFIGNIEGRDFFGGACDVAVTDGFTGNVALKTMEGAVRFFMRTLGNVFDTSDATRAASEVLWPELLTVAKEIEPDETGGAMLLGVKGVCVISHGSSNARAMVNAIAVAYDLARGGLVERLAKAIAEAPVTS